MFCYVSRKKSLLAFLVMFAISGCTSQYTARVTKEMLEKTALAETHRIERDETWQLPRNSRIHLVKVSQAAEEYYGQNTPLRRSRNQLFTSLQRAFGQTFPHTAVDTNSVNLKEALKTAYTNKADYLVYPIFVAYHNHRNTSDEIFEGKPLHPNKKLQPDSIQFELMILDVKTQFVLDTIQVRSRAKRIAKNGSLPIHLINKGAYAVVENLSGVKPG